MFSRNLDKARKAFKNKDVKKMIEAHSIASTLDHHQKEGKYIKSLIYGGLDGIITTFAVVAGVAGASLPVSTVLILGFANLVADGFSMAIGDYLSTKAENEYHKTEREREVWEVENNKMGEIQETIEAFQSKGYSKEDSKKLTKIVSKNKHAWIDMMLVDELGIIESDESPAKNALITFFSFGFFGFVPLLIYVISVFIDLGVNNFHIASLLTVITLFLLGSLKVKITQTNWIRSGLEMLLVGGTAAIVAYGIGFILSGLT